jgi:SNF family Na+-dependent transporter
MRARIPQDLIPGRKEMSVKERNKWNREWQKLVWSRPKYRWVFGISFTLLLVVLGGGIGRAFFLHAQKLQDKILIPIWCLVMSAMLAHMVQFAASRREMKARIEAAHGGKLPNAPKA